MATLPEHFEEFAEARRNGFIHVMEMKKAGKIVAGVFCAYTPSEVLDAAGIDRVVTIRGGERQYEENNELHNPGIPQPQQQ